MAKRQIVDKRKDEKEKRKHTDEDVFEMLAKSTNTSIGQARENAAIWGKEIGVDAVTAARIYLGVQDV